MARTQQLHLVTGKGGVGKTTVATALAASLAREGANVLLAEINGNNRISSLLGVPPAGYAMREVTDRLWVVNLTPQETLKEYVLLIIRIEALYRTVFENRLVESFLRLLPALGELTMLGKIWYELQQQRHGRPRFDAIVVDLPATGHARALLEAPSSVRTSIPPGPMRENADRLDAMVKDPLGTRMHIVTAPEEMPATEAHELLAFARAHKVPCAPLVVNQRLRPLPPEAIAALAPWQHDAPLSALREVLVRQEAGRQRGERWLSEQVADALPQATSLPHVVGSALDIATLERLGDRLVAGLRAVTP
jgi:anion-transporting  ArsA/GET3 family ATPase